ncbi:MAG: sigma 54-interacting transcriptional regulator [Magnetococcales bacterium]|nr:sigma 54-interacting transcriptional regulator [Magnetococcales bacterium]
MLRVLQPFFSSLEEGVLFLDRELRIITINQAAEKMVGRELHQVVGELCPTLFSGTECAKKCAKTKKCVLTPSKDKPMEDESLALSLERQDGSPVFLRMWATRLPKIEGKTLFSVILRDRTREVLLEEEVKDRFSLGNMVGHSPVMRELFRNIVRAAMSSATVLIQGESGTGKELVAKALHDNSSRAKGPYIRVHCASFPDNLLESELFGYVKGAFTGAQSDRMGRFEAAHGGTILLDEIGEISLTTQVKLLRVLQEKEVERLGENSPRKIDVRVVAATNRGLQSMVQEGTFREDLYYRLNVLPLETPSLRERSGDIPVLAQVLLEEMAQRYGREGVSLSREAIALLESYHWPGNVRELSNVLEYALVHSVGREIFNQHFPDKMVNKMPKALDEKAETGQKTVGYYRKPIGESEKDLILRVLQSVKGNKVQAAKQLNMSRTTLWKRLRDYGLG